MQDAMERSEARMQGRSTRVALGAGGGRMPLGRLGGLTLLCVTLPAAAVTAQQDQAVELRARDGSAVIQGDLVEVSDGSYVVKTPIGTLRISIDEADCVGSSCPSLDPFDRDFSIYASASDVETVIPSLLSGYADIMGANLDISSSLEGERQATLVDDETGSPFAAIDVRTSAASAIGPGGEPTAIGPGDLEIYAEPINPLGQTLDDELVLALSGAAIVVHPDNPISNLDHRTVAEIFSCSRTDWQPLGGPAGPVRVYARDVDSSLGETFEALVLQPFGLSLCSDVVRVGSDAELAARVASDPGGIGFVHLSDAYDSKPLAIRECSLTYRPSLFNAKTGDYPFVRSLLLHAPPLGESSAAAQRFVDFSLGNRGQQQLEQAGLVSLTINSTHEFATDYRLARVEAAAKTAQRPELINRLIDETENAARLSVTFRFRSGVADLGEDNALDNRSQRDLTRLVRFLKETGVDGDLMLFGFADASGDYEPNLALSELRAQSVADKLAALGVPVAVVAGLGEEAPIACNEDPAGRAKNRRVEVWLRASETDTAQQRLLRAPI